MQRAVVLIVLAISVVAANTVFGSEQSKRLYSLGLVEFHAKRYSKALDFFERAVTTDPADAYALYYRGVTRTRLNDYVGAIADLRTALSQQPGLGPAQLELGVALVQTNQYREAIPWLQQAQRVKSLDGRASMFLGIAQLRLSQTDAARQSFERAAARDESLRLSARYYEGVAAYREGHWSRAQEHFAYVATASPQSAMGHEAQAFLAKLREAEHATSEVYGTVGFQYDSNVVLAPSDSALKSSTNTALGISNEEDGRATINAGGAYVPWHSEHVQLTVGYDFYQSLHFRLHQFNIQDHRPSAQLSMDAGRIQFGLLGRYDYYFLDTDSFLQEVTVLPWTTISEGEFGNTEVFFRVRRRDFYKVSFRPRDSVNESPGIRQLFFLGAYDRYVSLAYRFDHEEALRTVGDAFAYDGNEVSAGIGWTFPAELRTEASYAFRHERYARVSLGRRDEEHQVICLVRKTLTEHLDLTGGYFFTLNNSNQLLFDYDRHVVSLALEVRL